MFDPRPPSTEQFESRGAARHAGVVQQQYIEPHVRLALVRRPAESQDIEARGTVEQAVLLEEVQREVR